MKRKQHVNSFLKVWHKCLCSATLDIYDMQENLSQSNLQLFFSQTLSLKGAMSRYFMMFWGNLKLNTSLKLENGSFTDLNYFYIINEVVSRKKKATYI